MDLLKEFYYFILHSITECKDEDLEYINSSYAICKKCGKKHFIFRSY